jgi:hypothetical protein
MECLSNICERFHSSPDFDSPYMMTSGSKILIESEGMDQSSIGVARAFGLAGDSYGRHGPRGSLGQEHHPVAFGRLPASPATLET